MNKQHTGLLRVDFIEMTQVTGEQSQGFTCAD